MLGRPRLRLPVSAALAIIIAAYLFRSLVIRKGDLALDLPTDLVVIAFAVIMLVVVTLSRHDGGTDDIDDAGDHVDGSDCEKPADQG